MRCIKCNHEVPAGFNICPNCGNQVGSVPSPLNPVNVPPARGKKNNRWKATSILSLVGAVMIMVFMFIPTWLHIESTRKYNQYDFDDYWDEDYDDDIYEVYGSQNLGLFSTPRDKEVRRVLFPTVVKIMAIFMFVGALILIISQTLRNAGTPDASIRRLTAGMDVYLPVILFLLFLRIANDPVVNMFIASAKASNSISIHLSFSFWLVLSGVVLTLVHPLTEMIKAFQRREMRSY